LYPRFFTSGVASKTKTMTRIKIAKQIEQSAVAGSIVTTNPSNEQQYVPPGANGTVLSIAAGVPAWAMPAVTGAFNGTTLASGQVQLGDDAGGTGQPGGFVSNRFINQETFNFSVVGNTYGVSRPGLLVKPTGEILMSAVTPGQGNHHVYFNPADGIFYAGNEGGSSYTGNNKVALGSDNSLNGANNQAVVGNSNTLGATYSTIVGYSNTVTGTNEAYVSGRRNNSSIGRSCILGTDNINIGDANVLIGYSGEVTGDYGNVVMGESCKVTGSFGNIAAGRDIIQSGSFANITLGHTLRSTTCTDVTVNIGCSSEVVSGAMSVSLGGFNKFSGFRQMQFGYGGVDWANTTGPTYQPEDMLLAINNGDLSAVTNSKTIAQRSLVVPSAALTVLHSGATQINNIAVTAAKTMADIRPAAALEIVSTTQGVLNPRLTAAEITTWESTFNATTHVTGPAGAGNEEHSRQGEIVFDLDATSNVGSDGEFKVRVREAGAWVTKRVAFVDTSVPAIPPVTAMYNSDALAAAGGIGLLELYWCDSLHAEGGVHGTLKLRTV
jgi:hypothetical protein